MNGTFVVISVLLSSHPIYSLALCAATAHGVSERNSQVLKMALLKSSKNGILFCLLLTNCEPIASALLPQCVDALWVFIGNYRGKKRLSIGDETNTADLKGREIL